MKDNSYELFCGTEDFIIINKWCLLILGGFPIVVIQKEGLAFHGIPHRLGKHMRMCL